MKLTVDTTTDYKRLLAHPISLAFPDIDAETFNGLIESMRSHGYDERHPIVLFQGKVLDGRNRLKAAKVAGVKPSIMQFEGDVKEAVEFALAENMHRRHLDQVQKALVLNDLVRFIPHEIGVNKATGETIFLKPGTNEKALANMGVTSSAAMRRAKVLGNDKKIAESVKNGEMKYSVAAKIVKEKTAPRQTQESKPTKPEVFDTEDGERLFSELVKSVKEVKSAVMHTSSARWGRHLSKNSIETDFDNIIRALRFATPFKPCPIANDCDTSCKLCGGTHWISRGQYDSLPKALQR